MINSRLFLILAVLISIIILCYIVFNLHYNKIIEQNNCIEKILNDI